MKKLSVTLKRKMKERVQTLKCSTTCFGDLTLFQDADLEHHPENFPDLINPFIKNNADVVFGTRLTGSKITKILGWPNLVGNKLFTLLANILFNKIFTDIATGYKVLQIKLLKQWIYSQMVLKLNQKLQQKFQKIHN